MANRTKLDLFPEKTLFYRGTVTPTLHGPIRPEEPRQVGEGRCREPCLAQTLPASPYLSQHQREGVEKKVWWGLGPKAVEVSAVEQQEWHVLVFRFKNVIWTIPKHPLQ
jgi:hypothetical protein